MTAGNKPAGGGKKAPAAPKASAANAAGGEQTAPADVMATALAAYAAALAAVPTAVAGVMAVAKGASAADRQRLRTEIRALVVSSFEGAAEAEGVAFQAFLEGEDEEAGELVEITARSRDGKAFRRAGFDWSSDNRTVHVPADVANRLKTDPNLLVKGF